MQYGRQVLFFARQPSLNSSHRALLTLQRPRGIAMLVPKRVERAAETSHFSLAGRQRLLQRSGLSGRRLSLGHRVTQNGLFFGQPTNRRFESGGLLAEVRHPPLSRDALRPKLIGRLLCRPTLLLLSAKLRQGLLLLLQRSGQLNRGLLLALQLACFRIRFATRGTLRPLQSSHCRLVDLFFAGRFPLGRSELGRQLRHLVGRLVLGARQLPLQLRHLHRVAGLGFHGALGGLQLLLQRRALALGRFGPTPQLVSLFPQHLQRCATLLTRLVDFGRLGRALLFRHPRGSRAAHQRLFF